MNTSKLPLYWETIKGAVKNPFFIMFLIGLFTAWSNADNAGIVAAVLAFVGIKSLVNIGTAVSDNDKQLSILEHFFLSSRTWVAVFGMIFCYYTRLPNEMKEVVIALAGGFGLDQIAVAVKGMNFNKFVRPTTIQVIPPMPQALPQQLQPYQPPVIAEIPVPVVAEPVPQIKDKIKIMREYYSKDKNYREYMLGGVNATVAKWIDKFVSINPMATTVEVAQEIAKSYFHRTLTVQECSTIQGILGLEAVIKSMSDIGITQSFFVAFDKMKELAWLEKIFRDGTVVQYTLKTIIEAATRASAGDSDIDKARLALQEFGISAYEAAHSQWSGNTIKAIYKIASSGVGFNLIEFNPYTLAGYTDIGNPL
jgi:hypothetical protein